MLKFFNANKKGSIKKLKFILESRKVKQKIKSSAVKKIISIVKRQGDKAVLKYEKKFSSVKSNSNKILFSKNEINKISNSIDRKLKSLEE